MSIKLRELVKTYSSGLTAIENISMDIESGEVFCLAGPNGAGKTTLIKQILGLLAPTSGTIFFNDIDVIKHPEKLRGRISYMPQRPYALYHLTVNEAILYAGRLRGIAKKSAQTQSDLIIERLGLSSHRNILLRKLSGGLLQLTSMGIASIGDPELIVLDEPTTHLDPQKRQIALEWIAALGQKNKTVIMVTHMLTEAEPIVDKIAIIKKRLLKLGTPAELRSSIGEFWKAKLSHSQNLSAPWPEECSIGKSTPLKTELLFPRTQFAQVTTAIERLLETGAVEDVTLGPPGLDEVYIALNERSESVAEVS